MSNCVGAYVLLCTVQDAKEVDMINEHPKRNREEKKKGAMEDGSTRRVKGIDVYINVFIFWTLGQSGERR